MNCPCHLCLPHRPAQPFTVPSIIKKKDRMQLDDSRFSCKGKPERYAAMPTHVKRIIKELVCAYCPKWTLLRYTFFYIKINEPVIFRSYSTNIRKVFYIFLILQFQKWLKYGEITPPGVNGYLILFSTSYFGSSATTRVICVKRHERQNLADTGAI